MTDHKESLIDHIHGGQVEVEFVFDSATRNSAWLLNLRIGRLMLGREDAIEMLGINAVLAWEEAAEEDALASEPFNAADRAYDNYVGASI